MIDSDWHKVDWNKVKVVNNNSMKYSDKVKELLEKRKSERIESYERYFEEYLLSQLETSMMNTCIVYKNNLLEEDINIELFYEWLSGEGFKVDALGSGDIAITLV